MDLDSQDYKRYINIRLNNKIKTFKDGELNDQSVYYQVSKCTEDNFQKNEFEQEYWKYTQMSNRFQMCIEKDDEVFL